ncbi:MAG: hypothetical protein F4227_00540 [Gammaproteobacteria bacterium]|nr:hypothetical protein [Gammaproteobacteria bacterium]MYF01500.1 hypothetical protein [Gammaproteobacteria bacterium]MYI77570.1 hypothetical protein [Gammaproteobacteria bacterium]
MFVEFVNWHSRATENPPVLRDFAAILGLKKFLLWYWHKNVQESGGTLNALTLGRFTTPEATTLRVDALFADRGDFLANFSVSAARGLGQCQTDEGFRALVERMEQIDDIHLASFVVEAIVSYGTKALAYKDKLTQIGKRFQATAETEFEPASEGYSLPTELRTHVTGYTLL